MWHIGKREWLIPDMYYPEITASKHYVSHESICVLNTGDADAEILITLYFETREPVALCPVLCAARRTHHIRMDKQLDLAGNPVPKGVPYTAHVKASVPVTVQYSRADTTDGPASFMTTMAYPK
ncbi:MAG: sensory rhodopsin transducer [Bacillota bacterium]